MSIRASGLVSGLDTNAIIDALVKAERMPISKLQTQRADFSTQLSKIGQIKSSLATFATKAADLSTFADVLAYSASSSESDAVTASCSGQAVAGTYKVRVDSLAAAEKDRSAAFASSSEAVKEGTLTIEVAGEAAVQVDISAGDNLNDVVSAINASDAEVVASLISDGSNSYISLTATAMGHPIGGVAADAIVLTESYTGSSGGELTFSQIQQASNALVNVDGLEIEHRDNSLEGVVPGTVLELQAETASVINLTIATDDQVVTDKVRAFVDAFNALTSKVQSELAVGKDTDRAAGLAGDPMLRTLRFDLSGAVTGPVSGVGDGYSSLASIGITTSDEGILVLDEAKLSQMLAEDPSLVGALFATTDTGVAQRVQSMAERYLDSVDGSIKNRVDGLNQTIDGIDDQIESLELRTLKYQEQLVAKFTALEQTLSALKAQESYLFSFLGS